MDEEYIINQLTLNAFNYQKFGDAQFYNLFEYWIIKLKDLKAFDSIDETTDYLLNEKIQGQLSA